ncbi:hypothetical protein Kisp01_65740 [Kineosporia sp. NBRC 101677]|uniref:class I SAM-dependent methyltransferase n=1 Tax=Kineosporia sp. NBRC 101677 TaxID=3032197 RepID=UPI0024A4D5FA|nr:class I SAM-dependent methyltransferase [Kineosporia sp. NBRC 101677]GLY19560.1 hypothetical protein Kisp01_65740 [Kineosporia sp. NBRC 101677]
MSLNTPAVVRSGNNLYRDPELLDELMDDTSYTDRVLQLIGADDLPARDVLDLGCGTGRVLAQIAQRRPNWRLHGVDFQTDLLLYAARRYPLIGWTEEDIRTLSLEMEFDAVTILGHSFSYLMDDHDVDAVLDVAMGHLRPGGLLVVHVLPEVRESPELIATMQTCRGEVTLRTLATVNGRGRRLTTRSWTFHDSGVVWHDVFEQRAMPLGDLAARAQQVGFRLVPGDGDVLAFQA